MERNIESILSELGIDYHFYGNTKNKRTFRNVATIQQGKEEDLCYCSFDGEEALSLISESKAGIILCKGSLEQIIDRNYRTSHLLTKKQQLIFVDNPRAAFIKIINKTNICEIFIKWDLLCCPCCGYKLRTKPRNSLFKKRFAIVAKQQGSIKHEASIQVRY